MDELLFSTDAVLASEPTLTDVEAALRIAGWFAHPCLGEIATDPAVLLEFVREVRHLHPRHPDLSPLQ